MSAAVRVSWRLPILFDVPHIHFTSVLGRIGVAGLAAFSKICLSQGLGLAALGLLWGLPRRLATALDLFAQPG